MIKRTLYFGNPAYLSLSNGQLVIRKPDDGDLPLNGNNPIVKTIPVEDIGVVVIDNRQITLTSALVSAMLDHKVAVVSCDEKSMPTGLLLPLYGNDIQNERFRDQIDASLPLRKQLWQQTVEAKILNQAAVLKYVSGEDARNMLAWAGSVKSGDSDNLEGRAAAYYWRNVFPALPYFNRGRFEESPNNLLNYGYAVLRAAVARSLVAAGLLPTLGIHHHNRYNAYCLADDIMEPYRPYVDRLVVDIIGEGYSCPQLTRDIKARVLSVLTADVFINERRSPLMLATMQTASSLNKCFRGESRKLIYPTMICQD